MLASLLGITHDGANELAALVRQAATDGDITQEEVTIFGRSYRVDWAIPARGNVVLRTIWKIAPGEKIPRLISACMHS